MPVEHVSVAYDSSDFRVSVSTLRPLVDVRAADDSKAIVHNAHLAMDVHLFRCQHFSAQLSPVAEREDSEVVIGLGRVISATSCIGLKIGRTSIPSFLNRPKIELGPRHIVLF